MGRLKALHLDSPNLQKILRTHMEQVETKCMWVKMTQSWCVKGTYKYRSVLETNFWVETVTLSGVEVVTSCQRLYLTLDGCYGDQLWFAP